jgi:hypothetical protein
MRKTLISILLTLYVITTCAQNQTGNPCVPGGIHFFCTESNEFNVATPAITGNDQSAHNWIQQHNISTCLASQPNGGWYLFQIAQPGDLVIFIEQYAGVLPNGHPDPNTSGRDVDFACWGPFSSNEVCDQELFAQRLCNEDFSLTSSILASHRPANGNHSNGNTGGYPVDNNPNDPYTIPLVDCSYNASSTEWCFIPNAQQGDWYLMLICNYGGQPGYFGFTPQTITGDLDPSAINRATTNCDMLNCLSTNNEMPCEGSEITLYCTIPQAELPDSVQYRWIAPDGTEIATTTDSTITISTDTNMTGFFELDIVNTYPERHGLTYITVLTTPAVINASDTSIYLGDSIVLSTPYYPQYDSTYFGYYRWYFQDTEGAPISTDTSLVVYPTEDCQYILVVKNGETECTNSNSISITVLPEVPEDSVSIRSYVIEKTVRIYPNPTKDIITIQLVSSEFLSEELLLQLFDETGRQLQSWKMRENTCNLNMTAYPSGTYLLKVMNKKRIIDIQKIIKQ